jgi:predicted PurR-regulated permease PerM
MNYQAEWEAHSFDPSGERIALIQQRPVSFFRLLCCLPIWFGNKLKSRHAVTWLILSLLLVGVGLVLLVYIVPLANKANLVADEARELVKVSLEKINKIDRDVSGLIDEAHTRLENIDQTVQGFIQNATYTIDNMDQKLDNSLQAIETPSH